MKIYVDQVFNKIIYFSTAYENARGIWRGVNRPNKREYFVELDIDIKYNYDDFMVSKVKEYQMKIVDYKTYLTLLFLEHDEFGCATFRLGDSIIEIETNIDDRFLALKNLFVIVSVEKINIYDENI